MTVKIIYASSVQFNDTLSTYYSVCSPPKVKSPITIYPPLTSPAFPATTVSSGNHHIIVCV